MKRIQSVLVLLAFIASVALLFGVSNTAAADFPSKPIKIVVPYGPGGGSDISARIFVKYLGKYVPTPVVVSNVAGANGRAGEIEVKGSKADGYTLLWQHQTIHMAYVTGRADRRWDEMFTPIASPVKAYSALVVANSSPYNSTEQLVAAINQNPAKIRWGVGLYSNSHFALLDLVESTRMNLGNLIVTSIPGDKDRVLAILQGNMEATAITISSVKPYLESGDLKILCAMGETRSDMYAKYPTCKELGFDAVNRFDYTLYAPKGLPEENKKILADAVLKASKDPELLKELNALWMSPEYYVGDDLVKKIESDFVHVQKLAEKAQISKKN